MQTISPKLEDLLSDLGSDYQTIEQDESFITKQYRDAYDVERITLEVKPNEYGVPIYYLLIESYSFNDEIVKPESCHDCFPSCMYYKNGQCNLSELEIAKEEREHLELKALIVNLFNGTLTIFPEIFSETCHLNVTHEHYYKGYVIGVKNSSSPDTIRTVINARDIILRLYLVKLKNDHP